MNTKQTLLLLILAVALAGAALWYSRHEEEVVASAGSETTKLLDPITSGTITKIEVNAPGEKPVTLTKKDATWYTDAEKGHRADKNGVNNIFAALDKEISGEVVSEKEDSHTDYMVDETSGTHVQMFKGDEKAADFFVGKDGPASFTTYMRKAGDKKVVNAKASLSYLFKRPDGWRDKGIFELTSDQITALSAEGTSATFDLKKENGVWMMKKPDYRPAEAGKVSTMLSMLSMLRTNDFADTTSSPAEMGLDPPQQKYNVTYEDRATSPPKPVTVGLIVGHKKEGGTDYFAKRTDQDTIYTVSEYTVKALAPELKDLAPPPAKPEDSETTATKTQEGETTGRETVKDETTGMKTEAVEAPSTEVEVSDTTGTETPGATGSAAPVATDSSTSPTETAPAEAVKPDSTTTEGATAATPAP